MKKEIYKIHKTCSPSATPLVIDIKQVLLITMSCGGGMGGSRWDELVIDEESKIPSNTLHQFINAIDGTEFTLNRANIVKIVPKQLLVVYDDITAHVNYTSKVCKKAWNERYIVLDRDQKWECVEQYSCDRNEVFKSFSYRD